MPGEDEVGADRADPGLEAVLDPLLGVEQRDGSVTCRLSAGIGRTFAASGHADGGDVDGRRRPPRPATARGRPDGPRAAGTPACRRGPARSRSPRRRRPRPMTRRSSKADQHPAHDVVHRRPLDALEPLQVPAQRPADLRLVLRRRCGDLHLDMPVAVVVAGPDPPGVPGQRRLDHARGRRRRCRARARRGTGRRRSPRCRPRGRPDTAAVRARCSDPEATAPAAPAADRSARVGSPADDPSSPAVTTAGASASDAPATARRAAVPHRGRARTRSGGADPSASPAQRLGSDVTPPGAVGRASWRSAEDPSRDAAWPQRLRGQYTGHGGGPESAARRRCPSRGATPRSPRRIPARGWARVVRRAGRHVMSDRLQVLSAGISFFAILSIAPVLVTALSVYGAVNTPAAGARPAVAADRPAARRARAGRRRAAHDDHGGLGAGADVPRADRAGLRPLDGDDRHDVPDRRAHPRLPRDGDPGIPAPHRPRGGRSCWVAPCCSAR